MFLKIHWKNSTRLGFRWLMKSIETIKLFKSSFCRCYSLCFYISMNKQIKPKQKFISLKWKFLNDSSILDSLPSTQKSPSNLDNPKFTRIPKQTYITDFSHIPEVNIRNIFGELTPAKFRNLTFTELENDIKVIVQNGTKNTWKMKHQSRINQLMILI